ncbi:MAG: FadR/GntR family transcriptional regulator [Ectobacillus sp.]
MAEDGLEAGDKLPSERELSARLNVGRSSVREALRALELVGLIETRRGEGTFVKNFYEHGLVQLLATFLLQNEKTKQDLLQVQRLIEQDAIRLLCQAEALTAMESIPPTSLLTFHQLFWKEMIKKTQNHLLYRIWLIINDYTSTLSCDIKLENRELYLKIYRAVESKNEPEALRLYALLQEKIVFSG